VGDSQPTVLGACLTNEVMSGAWIKKKDNGVSVQEKHTSGDLLALRNIFHGIVVDATGLLWHGVLSSEVARATTVEADVAGGGSSGWWRRQAQHMWRWR
jgi:hypothetical protein